MTIYNNFFEEIVTVLLLQLRNNTINIGWCLTWEQNEIHYLLEHFFVKTGHITVKHANSPASGGVTRILKSSLVRHDLLPFYPHFCLTYDIHEWWIENIVFFVRSIESWEIAFKTCRQNFQNIQKMKTYHFQSKFLSLTVLLSFVILLSVKIIFLICKF